MAKVKPIGLGIVGTGRAGLGMHCRELKGRERKFNIAAACDIIPARRKTMAEQHGCNTYRDVKDLIADPAVELVDIATRSGDHVDHALMALRAGKQVFIEKPVSLTHRGAQRIFQTAQKVGVPAYVRHNRRFERPFQHIREIIASGLLGEVYEIKLRRNGYSRRDDWQTLIDCGGGQLLNWGPHVIDHGLQMLGAPVAEVWSDLKRISAVGDAEDHLKIIIKGENGRLIDIEISGGAAISEPQYIVLGNRGGLRCTGSTIDLRYINPRKKLSVRRPKRSTPTGGFGSPDSLPWIQKSVDVAPKLKCNTDHIWDYLYDTIRKGKPFPIKNEEALAVMKVVDQVKRGTRFAALPGQK